VPGQRAPDDVDLAAQPVVVDTGAAPDDLLGRRAREGGGQRARRRGVADPMSPMPSSVTPPARELAGDADAGSSACTACARVIAPRARGCACRRRSVRCGISGTGGSAVLTPMSTTTTRAPAWRASTLMAAPPRAKLSSICAVTSCG